MVGKYTRMPTAPSTLTPNVDWPETLSSVAEAKALAVVVKKETGVKHRQALLFVAVRYGFRDWNACRLGVCTEAERYSHTLHKVYVHRKMVKKWEEGIAERKASTDALATVEPGWVGKASASAGLDPGMRPVNGVAALVSMPGKRRS